MLPGFSERRIKYVNLYMLNLCDGFVIKLGLYLEWQYIEITVYRN